MSKNQTPFSTPVVKRQALCEDGVVVEFILTNGYTIEDMNVNIYAPIPDSLSLVGNLMIKNDSILYEQFPDDFKIRRYYLIGMECIKRVREYPSSILG